MTIATDPRPVLTCELLAFAAVVAEVLPTVVLRFGVRKVYISALWPAVDPNGSITLNVFKRRLLSARAAGLLELARADLVAAMDPALVADSATRDLGAEYHFVVDRSASDPWVTDAAPTAHRIPVIGAAS